MATLHTGNDTEQTKVEADQRISQLFHEIIQAEISFGYMTTIIEQTRMNFQNVPFVSVAMKSFAIMQENSEYILQQIDFMNWQWINELKSNHSLIQIHCDIQY